MFFIKEFLNNPAGKGSSILNINATKSQYIERYDKIVKKISHRVFLVKKDIYFLINIPSSVEGIKYDIVVRFQPTSKSTGESIVDMNMQIFSNSPSFLYTYAYAYDKQKLFLREFKRKLSSKMLNDIAKTKNPYGVLSYDFSVFSALHYIVVNDYLKISTLESIGEKGTLSTILRLVKNADDLQKDRKFQKDYNKLMEQEKIKNAKNKIKYQSFEDTEKKEDPAIKKIKNVKSSKSIKKTVKVTRIKKRK